MWDYPNPNPLKKWHQTGQDKPFLRWNIKVKSEVIKNSQLYSWPQRVQSSITLTDIKAEEVSVWLTSASVAVFDTVGWLQRHLIVLLLLLFLLHQTLLFLPPTEREELLLSLSVLLIHSWEHTKTENFIYKNTKKQNIVDTVCLICFSDPSCPPACPTFLSVFDDLSDGFLQTVGSQHQLFSRFKDGCCCRGRGGGVGPWGAGRVRMMMMMMMKGRRRRYNTLHFLLLLSDGGWRSLVGHGGGLRLFVQSLQQWVEFLLQYTALTQTGIISQDTEWWNTFRTLHSISHSSVGRHRMYTWNGVIQFGFLILQKWWNSSRLPAFILQLWFR